MAKLNAFLVETLANWCVQVHSTEPRPKGWIFRETPYFFFDVEIKLIAWLPSVHLSKIVRAFKRFFLPTISVVFVQAPGEIYSNGDEPSGWPIL